MARLLTYDTDAEKAISEPYHLHEITFTVGQVIWCLSIITILRQGLWPQSEECPSSHSKGASWRTPIELAAEIDSRLEMTGIDGAMAEAHFSGYRSSSSIAKQYHLEILDVKHRIWNAIKYMAGKNRKRRSYKEWLNHRKGAS